MQPQWTRKEKTSSQIQCQLYLSDLAWWKLIICGQPSITSIGGSTAMEEIWQQCGLKGTSQKTIGWLEDICDGKPPSQSVSTDVLNRWLPTDLSPQSNFLSRVQSLIQRVESYWMTAMRSGWGCLWWWFRSSKFFRLPNHKDSPGSIPDSGEVLGYSPVMAVLMCLEPASSWHVSQQPREKWWAGRCSCLKDEQQPHSHFMFPEHLDNIEEGLGGGGWPVPTEGWLAALSSSRYLRSPSDQVNFQWCESQVHGPSQMLPLTTSISRVRVQSLIYDIWYKAWYYDNSAFLDVLM